VHDPRAQRGAVARESLPARERAGRSHGVGCVRCGARARERMGQIAAVSRVSCKNA
jgi:hypothetical protein